MSNITEERVTPLLPCPLCGIDVNDDEGVYPIDRNNSWWTVVCGNTGCRCSVELPSRDEAIAAWNRRASAPVLSEEQREALKAGAMALYDDNCFIESRRGVARTVVERDLMVAQAALLRAMAERG